LAVPLTVDDKFFGESISIAGTVSTEVMLTLTPSLSLRERAGVKVVRDGGKRRERVLSWFVLSG
jgi:hypothetical protein